jgi:hypothetical protein
MGLGMRAAACCAGMSAFLTVAGSELGRPSAATAEPAAPSVASCQTIDCLREAILDDATKAPTAADCKPLEGRREHLESDPDAKTELAPICRLLVARRASGGRATAPCLARRSITPDWDPAIRDTFSLEIDNKLLSQAPLARHGIKVPEETAGFNNSTIHGTYVFDRQFGDGGRRVQFATHFCIADGPYRYVPYYYTLSLDDKGVDEAAVAKPPEAPILEQVARFKNEDDQHTFLYVDLNGDRKKDIVVMRNHNSSRTHALAACLYNPKGSDCVPVVPVSFTIERVGALHLSSTKDATLVVELTEFNDPPSCEWRFRLSGAALKLISQRIGPSRDR